MKFGCWRKGHIGWAGPALWKLHLRRGLLLDFKTSILAKVFFRLYRQQQILLTRHQAVVLTARQCKYSILKLFMWLICRILNRRVELSVEEAFWGQIRLHLNFCPLHYIRHGKKPPLPSLVRLAPLIAYWTSYLEFHASLLLPEIRM